MGWASILHGILLGLPLMVLTALCVSYTWRMGKLHPWWHERMSAWKRYRLGVLLTLAWLTPLTGLAVMYIHPEFWQTHQGVWDSPALPWMASWGLMVPIAITACTYLMHQVEKQTLPPIWLQRALWGLMSIALGNVLLAALLGSLTARGVF